MKAVIQGNSLEVYQAVVPAGFNLNYDHRFIGGGLCWCGNDVPLAAYLLSQRANPNLDLQTRRYTPLTIAARMANDNAELVELYIRHGAQTDWSGALTVAAECGNLKVARRLISRGANVNLNGRRDTPIFSRQDVAGSALHKAIQGGHAAIVALLMENGADVRQETAGSKTAVGLARDLGKSGIARFSSKVVDARGTAMRDGYRMIIHGSRGLVT